MIILIIKYKCGYRYENIMMILKITLDIKARNMILQEFFISNWKLCHSRFNF